jgi:hypothetical protein
MDELGMVFPEGLFGGIGDVRMIDDPLVRGLRSMVFFDNLGAVTLFFPEFQAGTEVILQGAPK